MNNDYNPFVLGFPFSESIPTLKDLKPEEEFDYKIVYFVSYILADKSFGMAEVTMDKEITEYSDLKVMLSRIREMLPYASSPPKLVLNYNVMRTKKVKRNG